MKKETMSILASAIIATSLVAATLACSDETTTPSAGPSTDTVVVSPGDFHPSDPGSLDDMKATLPMVTGQSISGQSSVKYFTIPANFGWVKVFIDNTGAYPITFTLNQGTPGGAQKMSGTVKPHDKQSFYSHAPLSTGLFYLNLSCNDSMRGRVRIGTDLNELKNMK